MNMKRLAILLASLCLLVVVSKDASALYKLAGLEPFENGTVPVCWAPGINPESDIPKTIRQWVESTWSQNANVTFTGWGNCAEQFAKDMPDEHRIFIQRTGGRSQSDPGPQTRNGVPRPTLMELNFNASWLCDTFPWLGYSNKECVVWTAVHEFGHALGFLHEHDRPDFSGCRQYDWAWPNKQGGGEALTVYDSSSVMNYCSDGAGTNKGRLTPRDITGLQAVYGRKPAGSFVAVGGRCMDVHNIDIQDGNRVQIWECWGRLNQLWNYSTIDGTLRSEEAPDMCLDDPSGGTVVGTPLDVWNCPNRANNRWDVDVFDIHSLGGKCLQFTGGSSAAADAWRGQPTVRFAELAACLTPGEVWRGQPTVRWSYNLRGQFVQVGTNKCLDVSPGEVGSRAHLAACTVNSYTQKFLLTNHGQLLSNGRCLEVADSMPFKVDLTPGDVWRGQNLDFRLAECDDNVLTQKFHLKARLKSSGGKCVSLGATDISRNGMRLVVGDCNKNPELFDFYPRDVEAQF
jgi:hypothetical protein